KYDVYFTYDRTIIDDITVQYEDGSKTSIDLELEELLIETEVKFKIYDGEFIILFKESDEGLKSMKEMMKYFEKLIDEKESANSSDDKGLSTPASRLLPSWTPPIHYLKELAIDVSGKITDEDGQPLIGVNITVKNKNTGTSSDFAG